MIVPIVAILVADTTAGAYGSPSGRYLQLQSDTDGSAYALIAPLTSAASSFTLLFDSGSIVVATVSLTTLSAASGSPTVGISYGQDPTAYDNAPLYVALVGGSGEMPDGHADNTLTITVLYALVDL